LNPFTAHSNTTNELTEEIIKVVVLFCLGGMVIAKHLLNIGGYGTADSIYFTLPIANLRRNDATY